MGKNADTAVDSIHPTCLFYFFYSSVDKQFKLIPKKNIKIRIQGALSSRRFNFVRPAYGIPGKEEERQSSALEQSVKFPLLQ